MLADRIDTFRSSTVTLRHGVSLGAALRDGCLLNTPKLQLTMYYWFSFLLLHRSYLELLLSLPDHVPESLWQRVQASVQVFRQSQQVFTSVSNKEALYLWFITQHSALIVIYDKMILSFQYRSITFTYTLNCIHINVIFFCYPPLQSAHDLLQKNGIFQLQMLSCLSQATGVWSNSTLQSILSSQALDTERGSFPFHLHHLFNPHPLLNGLIYTQHLRFTLMNSNSASV